MNTIIEDGNDFFEELASNFPELFEKSQCNEYIAVGSGWFDILHAWCECVCIDLHNAQYALKAAIDYPRLNQPSHVHDCENQIHKAIDNLPIIIDIKDKFGTLRIQLTNFSEKVQSYTRMAERMSRKTCEVCGNKATIHVDDTGYSAARCARHKSSNRDAMFLDGRIPPIFGDEDH